MDTTETKDTCAEGFCPHVDPKKHFALIASIVFVGVVIGIVVTAVLPPPFGNYQKGYDAGHKAGDQFGFDRAKKLVENSKFGDWSNIPKELHTLSGAVSSVNGNNIKLHVQLINPFDDVSLEDRIVSVSSSTVITKFIKKDQKEYDKEVVLFKLNTSTSTPAPLPFKSIKINLNEIKVGDSISVTSLENIKMLKGFTASEILIPFSGVIVK